MELIINRGKQKTWRTTETGLKLPRIGKVAYAAVELSGDGAEKGPKRDGG